MADPKTLMEMAGAPQEPSRLDASTVVMIDCQNEYVDGKLPLVGIGPALDEGARLLEKARAAGTPIVHIVHEGKAGGVFDLDGHGGQIAAQVVPADGEPIVKKPLPNAFAHTELHDLLQEIGRKEIIFAGFQSHMCISSSARAALDLGYRATVVANAVATRDLPRPGGGVIGAVDLHNASLAALADRFAIIAPDADAIS
ncbi:MAG: cysteine hydrolase family protein [Hyphomicrobiales bacterium]